MIPFDRRIVYALELLAGVCTGEWLEQAGEADAAILGEHFARCERGGISASR